MEKIEIYDSTLRDGSQMHNINFSISDRIKIIKKLDEFGIDYIEAGNPGSNPKEKELFNKIKEIELKNSKIVAFGSTTRVGIKPEDINARIKFRINIINNKDEYYSNYVSFRIPLNDIEKGTSIKSKTTVGSEYNFFTI